MTPEEKRAFRFRRRRDLMLLYWTMVQNDALDDLDEALQAYRLGRTFTHRLARASSQDLIALSDLGENGTVPLGVDGLDGTQLLLGQIQALEESARIEATRLAVASQAYAMTPEGDG